MSFQEEWERKKEERHRKRIESMDGGVTNGSVSPTTKTSHVIVPSVQLKQTPKSPMVAKNVSNGEKPLNEAEKKAEELRQKREQERVEAEQRVQQEFTMTTVSMTPERKEEIRRAREEREQQEKQEAEERKARAEEETRKMREEIQRRRQEAEAKRKLAEEENQTMYSIPKYNIAENIARAKQEKMQTSAEMMAEREKKIKENFPQIRISAHDSEERLREIAEILHAKLVEVYSDMYDLEQRKERQEYDLNEMNARIKDLAKHKTVKVTPVDQGHVSMLKEKGFTFDDKAAKQKQNVDLKASLPSTGHIADRLQKLQNNLKKDAETPDKNLKKEPIKITYSTPEQLKEELEANKRDAERFKQQREENRKKREMEMSKMEQLQEERQKKAEEERKKQVEERERLKREKEEKEKARRNMINPSGAPIDISKVVSQQKAKNREQTIADRVPTMTITSTTTEAELRNFANDLYNKLKTTLGDVFDLDEQKKKNEYYLNELDERVGVLKSTKSSPAAVSSGIVSKMKDGGAWTPKKQNDVGKSFKPKERGGIASEGGVRGRLAMFSGGGDSTDSPPKKSVPAKVNIYK